jgi:hypothetical protein
MLRHVGTRWLTLYPAIERLSKCWPAIKSYFLSSGADECPRHIWKYLKGCEEGETEGEESSIIPSYCAFLKNALLSFQCTLKQLERDSAMAAEIFALMEELKNKINQSKAGEFVGEETEDLLMKLDIRLRSTAKKDFLNFCDHCTKYLEKCFNFLPNNYLKKIEFLSLKKEPSYSVFKDAVIALNLKSLINLDELYEEFCTIKPSFSIFINDESERTLHVSDKWCQIFEAAGAGSLPNIAKLLSSALLILVCNAYVERLFSLMKCYWRDKRNKCSVKLFKSEVQIKMNYQYCCKDFYFFMLHKKYLLEAAKPNTKYVLKFKK